MAKPTSKTKEETLLKKKIWYWKMKSDPELYAEYKRKNRLKYEKRKEQKKIIPVNEMTSSQQRIQIKKWREERNRRYNPQKDEKAKEKQLMTENSPPRSEAVELLSPEREQELIDKNIDIQPSCSRPLSLSLSPSSSLSSPCSSGTVSPKAKELIRKLTYKNYKEIMSLRRQLEAVKQFYLVYGKHSSNSAGVGHCSSQRLKPQSTMSLETLCVKIEAEEMCVKEEAVECEIGDPGAHVEEEAECDSVASRELYVGHQVKEELVLGPEEFHRPCATNANVDNIESPRSSA